METMVLEHPDYWRMKCPLSDHSSVEVPRDGRWDFNGDYERPTFSPSINETSGKAGQSAEEFRNDPNPHRNHFFIRSGFIEYLSDSTHRLAGQLVELKPFSEAEVRCHQSKYQEENQP